MSGRMLKPQEFGTSGPFMSRYSGASLEWHVPLNVQCTWLRHGGDGGVGMLARELMTASVVTINRRASVKDAIRMLHPHNITALPVVEGGNRLVGIVSEADLLRGRIMDDPRAHLRSQAELPELPPRTVGDVMTSSVVSVEEAADVSDVARLMLETGVKSLPVVRLGRVVGMISRRDLIAVLAASEDRIKQEIDSLLADAGLDYAASVDDGVVVLAGHGFERDQRIALTLARTVGGVTRVHLRERGRDETPRPA
jgi:CBS domain-containing protein